MFVDCMYRVPSRCCNIAYKHSTKCNSVSLNVRVWDAASSGTKCNAIQMRPNVARRLSDFATNSRAMTSQCCIVCPRVGLHAEQPGDWVAVDSLSCASMFSGDAVMRSCVRPKSWGGPCSFALHTHVANPPLPHSLFLPFAASSHISWPKKNTKSV